MESNTHVKKDRKTTFKGIIGGILKSPKKKSATESHHSKEDETNDHERISANTSLASLDSNHSYSTHSYEDEKVSIQFDALAVSDEFSQGKFTSLNHGIWRNKEVAVVKAKDDNPLTIQNIEYQSRIVMEMKAHDHIWKCFGISRGELLSPCLVMEPMYGFLDDLIHGTITSLDGKRIVKFAKQIASGIQYLHSLDIIHGDLGCRSIMFDKIHDQYVLKIGGFDLSCFEHDCDTKIAQLDRSEHWSVRWAAPEVLLHNKLSKAADVWSFGVILWEICEKRRPYEGLTPAQVMEGVCHQRLRLADPYKSPIPPELVKLLRECWEEEPQYRPSIEEICTALDNLS